MDPYKLLSRSTKVSRRKLESKHQHVPPSGRVAQPQLFPTTEQSTSSSLGKRKRTGLVTDGEVEISNLLDANSQTLSDRRRSQAASDGETKAGLAPGESQRFMPLNERKRILKQHKVKITILNSDTSRKRTKVRASKDKKVDRARCSLFPCPLLSLDCLKSQYGISQRLSQNISEQGYQVPTEVQLAALPLLLDSTADYITESTGMGDPNVHGQSEIDLLTVAPTGSGKTLSFMIPMIQSILSRRHRAVHPIAQTSAIILAPTKELVSQITNEGRKLVKGTGITISLVRKGMRLSESNKRGASMDTFAEESSQREPAGTVTKTDIIVSTPGILQKIIEQSGGSLLDIHHLILDEADVLLDPTFREQTLAIWDALPDPGLRVSMWSATMGSSIESLVISTVAGRRKRLLTRSDIEVAEAPLIRLIVGLKDSAVPNISHRLIYAATEKGKLLGLRQLLHPSTSTADSGPTLRPPFLIFTQTIERAIALSSELTYDIPTEAGGSSRIAVLHSDLSDSAREKIMTRFRKSEIWVLITTDLLSRGIDFRGVNGVVNYDIPTSSAAYVHRIGRTGRAGRDGGVAVTLYDKDDIPYLKHVANVVVMSQKDGGTDGVQQWLLDALPKLSKNERKNLKSRGIESRTLKGQKKDPKVAQKSRISTKAGFVRRLENKRRGAIVSSQRRLRAESRSDRDEETEFAGFD